jgi:hypothetical protein
MPNDCYNYITITHKDSNELDNIINTEFSQFLTKDYTSNNNQRFYIYRRGDYGIEFKLWTPWRAEFEWLESFIEKYPEAWIKNTWLSEDGSAGIWIGTMRSGEKDIKRLDWQDMCLEEEMLTFSNW